MHDRLNQNDVTNKVDVEDPDAVRDAVLALIAARYPGARQCPRYINQIEKGLGDQ